jgi:ferredoxin
MDRCLAAGLPVASSCSGRGACGRCVVEVLAGAEALSPPTQREQRVLRRNGHPDGSRLSCRCRVLDPSSQIIVRTGYW